MPTIITVLLTLLALLFLALAYLIGRLINEMRQAEKENEVKNIEPQTSVMPQPVIEVPLTKSKPKPKPKPKTKSTKKTK